MRNSVAGAILAGGCSRRMGGRDKALLPLGGRPLLQHVIERVRPQVGALALSVERRNVDYEAFGLAQLPDPRAGHQGPLGGLLAALRHFAPRFEWVVIAPCDAPFLPLDLAGVLARSAQAAAADCAVARYDEALQPTFSIWRGSLLPGLEQAVSGDGLRGFKEYLRTIDAAECDWPPARDPAAPPPFLNVNDPTELRAAARWLRRAREECGCSA